MWPMDVFLEYMYMCVDNRHPITRGKTYFRTTLVSSKRDVMSSTAVDASVSGGVVSCWIVPPRFTRY